MDRSLNFEHYIVYRESSADVGVQSSGAGVASSGASGRSTGSGGRSAGSNIGNRTAADVEVHVSSPVNRPGLNDPSKPDCM